MPWTVEGREFTDETVFFASLGEFDDRLPSDDEPFVPTAAAVLAIGGAALLWNATRRTRQLAEPVEREVRRVWIDVVLGVALLGIAGVGAVAWTIFEAL